MSFSWRAIRRVPVSALPCTGCLSFTGLASGFPPSFSSISTRWQLDFRTSVSIGGKHSANRRSKRLDNVSPQFPLFSFILDDKTFSLVLQHVFPPHSFDLVCDEHQDLFWTLVAICAMVGSVTNITPSDISGTVDGKCDAVRHFSAPA